MLISNCCGASAKGGEDYEICSECFEHCEYIDEDEEEEGSDDGSLDIEFEMQNPKEI